MRPLMSRASRSERARLLARLSAGAGPEPGLCASCRHLEVLESPRSAFVRCGLARTDPAFPRYPRLPVGECRGWSRAYEPDGSVG